MGPLGRKPQWAAEAPGDALKVRRERDVGLPPWRPAMARLSGPHSCRGGEHSLPGLDVPTASVEPVLYIFTSVLLSVKLI